MYPVMNSRWRVCEHSSIHMNWLLLLFAWEKSHQQNNCLCWFYLIWIKIRLCCSSLSSRWPRWFHASHKLWIYGKDKVLFLSYANSNLTPWCLCWALFLKKFLVCLFVFSITPKVLGRFAVKQHKTQWKLNKNRIEVE